MLKLCEVEGCQREFDSRGMCGMHALQIRRHGRILYVHPRMKGWEHLQALIRESTDECQEPEFRARNSKGYPVLWFEGKLRLATHVVMMLLGVKRPEGSEILHSCDNTACVNRRHIRWGTHSENILEAVARKRWVHPRGYDYGKQ